MAMQQEIKRGPSENGTKKSKPSSEDDFIASITTPALSSTMHVMAAGDFIFYQAIRTNQISLGV